MKKTGLYVQAVFYIAAGINHFRHPRAYYEMIPPYLPAHSALNILAGIFEIVFGIMLLFTPTRKLAVYGIIVMLLAFIPVHIYFIRMKSCLPGLCLPEWTGWLRLLIIHPVLIAWAWWCRSIPAN